MDFSWIKRNRLLIGIIILGFLIRIIFLFSKPDLWWDESIYANLAHDLSRNFLSYSLEGKSWGEFIPETVGKYAWPNMGFRAPLLPYTLSLFYFLGIGALIKFFMPIIGTLSIILVYYLAKILFNKEVGITSSLLFALTPLHIVGSSMILTGVYSTFFILLTFICFWKGYEKGNNKYKVLMGVFLALSLLTRYTTLWIIPIFGIYLLIRYKSFRIFKDKYFWLSILVFLIIVLPWLIYGQLTYGNPFGAFIHGSKAATYWGGIQEWYFYFTSSWEILSIISLTTIISTAFIFYKRQFRKKEIYLLLIWIFFFLAFSIYIPHKETRFLLPIIPAICIISGYGIVNIRNKKIITGLIILILLISLTISSIERYRENYDGTRKCFLEANNFLKKLEKNSLVITDESPLIYYYSKNKARFYPSNLDPKALEQTLEEHEKKNTFIFYTDLDMPLYNQNNVKTKAFLDETYGKIFECDKEWGLSVIYNYSEQLYKE